MLTMPLKEKKERKKERIVSAKTSRQSDLTLDASVPPKTFPQNHAVFEITNFLLPFFDDEGG